MNLKKPKFWDLKKPNLYAYLLLPVAFILKILSLINSIKPKIKKTKIKTICIGNIYIGGTGKTSLSIKISNLLNERKIKSCFVKKIYKNQIDEQKLLESRGKLFLSSKRMDAINQAENENYQVAIMDDGLQDHSIDYDLSLVCFNNLSWIGNGLTMPAGPLRESINNLKKYKNVFLNGNLENLDDIKKYILNINSEINIFLGKYEALNINEFNIQNKYLVFSGIGNHKTFISMLKSYGLNIFKDIEFPDHYTYTNNDLDQIFEQAKDIGCEIITTEKDYLRLDKNKIDQIKYIKSELNIINEEKLIDIIMKNYETN
jgi:tetraacyldisaccharide 4'-kinase